MVVILLLVLTIRTRGEKSEHLTLLHPQCPEHLWLAQVAHGSHGAPAGMTSLLFYLPDLTGMLHRSHPPRSSSLRSCLQLQQG